MSKDKQRHRLFLTLLFTLLCLSLSAQLGATDFSTHRLGNADAGPTLLIVGGIDGDEPGGFHAAATLVTRYRIAGGQILVVPNLSFDDILKRRRGSMNLKFAGIDRDDRYYAAVRRIQALVRAPEVDLVLNLHDGSGFYHPVRIDSQRNPARWGQSFVIDQERIDASPFGDMKQLAETAMRQLNKQILSRDHQFQLKNSHTPSLEATAPARKSMTYFAIRQSKPAMAIEASKTDPVHVRTYYHLLALETFFEAAGIHYARDFMLTPESVKQVIADDGCLKLAEGRIKLMLSNMRQQLDYFPLPDAKPTNFLSVNPLITIKPAKQIYRIHYGNNRLAFINPLSVELDRKIDKVGMVIDGVEQQIALGSVISVTENFSIDPPPSYRANIIGYASGGKDDSGIMVKRSQLLPEYSIDLNAKRYRVEIYRGEKFSGMVLVDFRPRKEQEDNLLAQRSVPKVERKHKN